MKLKAIKFLLSLLCTTLIHAEKVELTVFIHGTLGAVCLLPVPKLAHKKWSDLENQWRVRWQQTYRQQPILKQFLPMLDFGLQIIEKEKLQAWQNGQAHSEQYKLAIYPITLAYNALHVSTNKKLYASFGWSGLLHDEPRTAASQELYLQLVAWCDGVLAQGDEPIINLLAHSHGGNVALKLPYQENVHHRGLSIETLVLWGTPIQEETIYFAESPMFKTIINCYSHYDFIQKGDVFSTRSGKSHQRLTDKIDCESLQKRSDVRRVDVELQVNGSSFSVEHANMWMIGKAKKLAKEMGHLPYMIFTPFLHTIITDCRETHVHANIITSDAKVHICVHDKTKKMCKVSANLKSIVDNIHTHFMQKWNPDEKHSGIIFSKFNPLNYLFKK